MVNIGELTISFAGYLMVDGWLIQWWIVMIHGLHGGWSQCMVDSWIAWWMIHGLHGGQLVVDIGESISFAG